MSRTIIKLIICLAGLSGVTAFAYQYDNACTGAAEINGNWYCSNSVQAITFQGFQQAGDYLQVTDMDNGQCSQAWRSFNSPLGSFGTGNDISLHLRGPLQLNELAYYTLGQNTKLKQKRVHKPGFHERRHGHGQFHDRYKALHQIEKRHVVSKALQKRGVCDLVSATFGTVVATWTNLWNGQSNVPATVCETKATSTNPVAVVTTTEGGRTITITLTVKRASSTTMSTAATSKTEMTSTTQTPTTSMTSHSTATTVAAENEVEVTVTASLSSSSSSTSANIASSGSTSSDSASSQATSKATTLSESSSTIQSSQGQMIAGEVVTVTESAETAMRAEVYTVTASSGEESAETITVTITSGTLTSTIHGSTQTSASSSSSSSSSLSSTVLSSSQSSGNTPTPRSNPIAASSSTISSLITESKTSSSPSVLLGEGETTVVVSTSVGSSTSASPSILLAGVETTVTTSTSSRASTSSTAQGSLLSSSSTQSSQSQASSTESSQSSSAISSSASSGTGSYVRQAYYSAPDKLSNGLIFLNHNGGQGSGVWDPEFGNSLSYASSDVSTGSATPQTFNGYIADNLELVILTDKECTSSTCGYSRPDTVAYQGFDNAHALFLFDFAMPLTNKVGFNMDMPAIWLLNAQIPRTLQYGNAACSCWESGCGEMDLFEVLDSGDDRMKSTWHGTNPGGSSYWFQRPQTSQKAGALLDETNSTINIFFLPDNADLSAELDEDTVNGWIQSAAAEGALFSL